MARQTHPPSPAGGTGRQAWPWAAFPLSNRDKAGLFSGWPHPHLTCLTWLTHSHVACCACCTPHLLAMTGTFLHKAAPALPLPQGDHGAGQDKRQTSAQALSCGWEEGKGGHTHLGMRPSGRAWNKALERAEEQQTGFPLLAPTHTMACLCDVM